jgi:hypothetical protein
MDFLQKWGHTIIAEVGTHILAEVGTSIVFPQHFLKSMVRF